VPRTPREEKKKAIYSFLDFFSWFFLGVLGALAVYHFSVHFRHSSGPFAAVNRGDSRHSGPEILSDGEARLADPSADAVDGQRASWRCPASGALLAPSR
jgi:hypothetical protein